VKQTDGTQQDEEDGYQRSRSTGRLMKFENDIFSDYFMVGAMARYATANLCW
jgi:hypothetical protein